MSLDRLYVSSYYDSVELNCDYCPRFHIGIDYLTLTEVIARAEEHIREKHGGVT